jgi:hypothetical protein
MKDWVTDGLGIMEVYMRNVVTGETRFVKNDGKGVTTIFSIIGLVLTAFVFEAGNNKVKI